jgi:hypothetical protein
LPTRPVRISEDTYAHIIFIKGEIERKTNRIVTIDEVVHGVFWQLISEINKGNDIGIEMLVNKKAKDQ